MVHTVTTPENQSAPARTETIMSDESVPDTSVPDTSVPDTSVPTGTPRSRGLIYALAGASVVIVALGVLVAIMLFGGVTPPNPPVALPPAAPSPSRSVIEPAPSASPSAVAGASPQEPAPAEPAPEKPAPVAPAPVLPAPPAPVVPPLSIDAMSASVSGACTDPSWIDLTWSTTGASVNSANITVRSGGGTPVFNQTWSGYPTTGSNSFSLDCTRPIWYFTLTVTNGSETKTGLLTFANGKTAGWSSGAP